MILESSVIEEAKKLSVAPIENGTVIDHIEAGKAILLLGLLKLDRHRNRVTVGLNLPSSGMKVKDIIKVEGWALSEDETSQIAIFSPQATVNLVENYQIVKKFTVSPPESISGIIICPNPNCITNHETTSRLFHVINDRKVIQLQCHYCEKCFLESELHQTYVVDNK